MDDRAAIEQLKYAYLRTLDLKRWDEFATLFLPDATGSYEDLTFASRDELVDYMSRTLSADLVTFHQVHHPEVDLGDGTAGARWYLHDKVFVTAADLVIEGAAFYEDRLRRTAEGWRFSHVGYRRTFESSWSTSGVPGWTFRRGTAYDAG